MPEKTVFISYNHGDSEVADRLKSALEAAGIEVRIDKAVMDAGANIQEFIESSVRDTDVTLSLVSNRSLESAWVAMETITAFYSEKLQNDKKFIACYIDDDFFKNNYRITATKRIDAKIEEIEEFIREHQSLKIDTQDLNSQLDRLYALRNSLGSILQRLRGSLTLDIRDEKFDESLRTILRTIGQPTASPSKRRKVELEIARKLLNDLSDSWRYTPLGGSARKKNIEMETVFEVKPFQVEPMSRGDRQQFETRQFRDAVNEILQIQRAVLLGEPGSGKSTTLYKLTADLCRKAIEDDDAPIPLLVPLGKWDVADQPLVSFIEELYPVLGDLLDQMLAENRVALLLDGLNELRVDQRDNKYKQVEHLIISHREIIAIVSCRELDYPPDKIDLKCDRINIIPLDPIRIRKFVTNYLDQEKGEALFWKLAGLYASDAYERFITDMKDKLAEPDQVFWTESELPSGIKWSWFGDDNWRWQNWVKTRETLSMMELASNPYMLMMLTGVYEEQNELPENRGDLFKSFIEKLLKRDKVPESEQKHLINGLAKVAYQMQIRRAEDDGERSASTVLPLEKVNTILGNRGVYLARSTNILSTGDPVRFTHQLLQEYFAAKYMDIEISEGRLTATEIWKPDHWWERTNWEEAAILLAGLYNNDCSKIVNWITEANPEVAAMCIDRSGAQMADVTRDQLRKQWLPRLTDLRKEPDPKARAAVGRALGLVNWDDRRGVGNTEIITEAGQKILLPDIDWAEIPEGEFQYGDESEYAAKPQKLTLPTFFISRYPITYAQFDAFLKDPEGYQNRLWLDGLAADDDDDRQMDDQYFEFYNHPRDTVNWYQAIAFCRWFSWRLGSTYDLKKVSKWAVRLPTEFEWEKAARGTDGRIYPYKGKYSPKKANTHNTGIGKTSAVGIFQNGASPYGVMDMSGNVLEWCLSDYEKPQLDPGKEKLNTKNARILRGGSWYLNQDFARAVYRNLNYPAFVSATSVFGWC
ncbi:MAG: SUMF1/EgtB/PvdO family nonheme iron enzyme [Acidobacteriota bacterium]|nr:MAG: SUMF1/EgtB/PvdO family nonheme iron enzyme [Acidobacteriota bacterium]